MAQSRLPEEEVTEIMSQVAVKVRGRKGWDFALPYDSSFMSRFPEVVERQGLIWQMKKQQRMRQASRSNSGDQGGSPQRRRSRSSRSISIGDGDEGEERRGGGGGRGRRRRTSSRSDMVGIPSKVEA